MSFFDAITFGLFDYFDPFTRSDKKMEKLMAEGELVPAKLYAVKYVDSSDNSKMFWGFDVASSSGPLRASVSQFLPYSPRIRLGGTLYVRHLNGRIGVDWAGTLQRDGEEWDQPSMPGKTLGKTLEPGVQDNRINKKRIANWPGAVATVTGVSAVEVMGMAMQNYNLELKVGDRAFLKKRENVPAYCLYMLEQAGLELPVALNPRKPDKLEIDWIRAAEEDAA